MLRFFRYGMLWLLTLMLAACGSANTRPESDLDNDTKNWKEIEGLLPAAPQPSDLASFYVSPASSYRFSIDRKSLSAGADGVVRYTLVSVSDQGARNVSYEGIRCETREKKLYAIGRSDGTWAKSRNAQWEPIGEANANRQHAALIKDVICPEGIAPQEVKPILERLK